MENILYLVVCFIASIIGAITGIGGGIVLKALVGLFSDDPVLVVSFYTTILVFSMCVITIFKRMRQGFNFHYPTLIGVSLGSIVGGYLGEYGLVAITGNMVQSKVIVIQSIILLITLLFLLCYRILGSKKALLKQPYVLVIFLLDVFLGSISIFLAIGGGPLNVSLFIIVLGFTMKDAAIYSLATVFF